MAKNQTSWQPGQTGNPAGRKPRAVESLYSEIFKEACTPAQWLKICKRATADALKGDRYARQWLGEYLIGKPQTPLDISPADAVLIANAINALVTAGYQPSAVFRDIVELALEHPANERLTAAPGGSDDE